MTGLDWIPLYDAFGKFEARARKQGLFQKELESMEKELLALCPLPRQGEENAEKRP